MPELTGLIYALVGLAAVLVGALLVANRKALPKRTMDALFWSFSIVLLVLICAMVVIVLRP